MTGDAMSHPTADDLVLHHYGEAEDGDAIARHLAECPACRAAFEATRTMLAAVEVETPERGADYGAQVWQRLEPRLGDVLRPTAPAKVRRFVAPRRLLWSGALAASLVAAFLLGRYLPRPAAEGTSAPVRERILLVAVGDHLERSQVVLLELLNADPQAPLDVTAERRSAEDLVSASRLYRQAAVRSGDAGVAQVLEELERVLVEVANGPSELGPADLAALRQRIEAQGVLFRVRVIGSRIREREKEAVEGPPRLES